MWQNCILRIEKGEIITPYTVGMQGWMNYNGTGLRVIFRVDCCGSVTPIYGHLLEKAIPLMEEDFNRIFNLAKHDTFNDEMVNTALNGELKQIVYKHSGKKIKRLLK